jgi:hypothetical protein
MASAVCPRRTDHDGRNHFDGGHGGLDFNEPAKSNAGAYWQKGSHEEPGRVKEIDAKGDAKEGGHGLAIHGKEEQDGEDRQALSQRVQQEFQVRGVVNRRSNQEFVDAEIGKIEPGEADPEDVALGAVEPKKRHEKQAGGSNERVTGPGDRLRLRALVHLAPVSISFQLRISQ